MTPKLNKARHSPPLRHRDRLAAILRMACELTGLNEAPGILQFVLLGQDDIIHMNQTFLGHEGATDVITFDLRPTDRQPEEDEVCGEIYVCPEVAVAAAAKYGTTPSRELVLYLVHGMLHLSGYDDIEPEDIPNMRAAEARVLAALEKRHSLEGFI